MAFCGESPSFDAFCDENWKEFTEKLDNFLSLNDITNVSQKTAILISCICEETYDIMRNLCYPIKPSAKSYDELIHLLNIVYNNNTNNTDNGATVFRKRYEFYQAKQNENETVLQWLERVKLLSQNCRFGDRYSSIIADRFFSGLHSLEISEKICQQHGAFKLWQLVEMAMVYEQLKQKQIVEKAVEKLILCDN